jgi:alpha-D-xyloside xylohydrolase
MRALAMDYRTDVHAANIGDQFMFGPAIMVKPVSDPGVGTTRVYLPQGKWYDFWSGVSLDGAHTFDSASPLDKLPIYIRAGSVLPLGPELEWSTEKPEDPLEVRVYRGADGAFTLYEDENDNYNYEKGAHATIPFSWDEGKQMLTIGDREGQFPGMLQTRTLRIVFVRENHGVGIFPEDRPEKIVSYSGQKITVTP